MYLLIMKNFKNNFITWVARKRQDYGFSYRWWWVLSLGTFRNASSEAIGGSLMAA
jgi:hypothetical protein